jgi:hypothetical protein
MRKITQFVVDTFIADLDGEDYEAGFIDGPNVVEVINSESVVVKGEEGMYVVTNVGTDDEFIMKLVERIEIRNYEDEGDDEVEIVEVDSELAYGPGGR